MKCGAGETFFLNSLVGGEGSCFKQIFVARQVSRENCPKRPSIFSLRFSF